jgi:putative flippase GtrA
LPSVQSLNPRLDFPHVGGRWKDFARYAAVAGGCFVLDVVLLVALHHRLHMRAGLAAAVAFAVASAVSFGLSRRWVFAQAARGGHPRTALARYVTLVLTGLGLTWIVVGLLTHLGLDYKLAKLIASGMVGLLNFVVMSRWVFAGGATAIAVEPTPVTAHR